MYHTMEHVGRFVKGEKQNDAFYASSQGKLGCEQWAVFDERKHESNEQQLMNHVHIGQFYPQRYYAKYPQNSSFMQLSHFIVSMINIVFVKSSLSHVTLFFKAYSFSSLWSALEFLKKVEKVASKDQFKHAFLVFEKTAYMMFLCVVWRFHEYHILWNLNGSYHSSRDRDTIPS